MKFRLLLTIILGMLFLFISETKAQWVQVNPPSFPSNNSITCFAVIGTNLFAGSNGKGIFLSTNDGTSWTAVDSGLTDTEVRALAVSGTNIFAGTWGSGVFLSTNNGTRSLLIDQ
ncbi:MAG: WD40/YVTN/BNR-like repeat-containing protein [Ignavibacteriaceae bacterium]